MQVGFLVGSSVVCLIRGTWFSLVFGSKLFTDCSLQRLWAVRCWFTAPQSLEPGPSNSSPASSCPQSSARASALRAIRTGCCSFGLGFAPTSSTARGGGQQLRSERSFDQSRHVHIDVDRAPRQRVSGRRDADGLKDRRCCAIEAGNHPPRYSHQSTASERQIEGITQAVVWRINDCRRIGRACLAPCAGPCKAVMIACVLAQHRRHAPHDT